MSDFTYRFKIIYEKFCDGAEAKGHRASKLALAKFLGISQGRLQNWENGKIPLPDDLKQLHEKFGFSYAWLVTGEGEPFAEQENSIHITEDRITELEKENLTLKGQLADAEAELREERSLNRQLTTRLLVEGASDQDGLTDTGKAAGQGG